MHIWCRMILKVFRLYTNLNLEIYENTLFVYIFIYIDTLSIFLVYLPIGNFIGELTSKQLKQYIDIRGIQNIDLSGNKIQVSYIIQVL